MEDIYEMLLPFQNWELTEKDISKLVRAAWVNNQKGKNNLRSFFIDTFELKSPKGNESTLDMVFDRYEAIREIRHAVVHNSGVLSQKNKSKLKELSEQLPCELRERSLVLLTDVGFIHNDKVELDIADLCLLRAWFYKVKSYFCKVFEGMDSKLESSVQLS